jgi:hypothetical protein
MAFIIVVVLRPSIAKNKHDMLEMMTKDESDRSSSMLAVLTTTRTTSYIRQQQQQQRYLIVRRNNNNNNNKMTMPMQTRRRHKQRRTAASIAHSPFSRTAASIVPPLKTIRRAITMMKSTPFLATSNRCRKTCY